MKPNPVAENGQHAARGTAARLASIGYEIGKSPERTSAALRSLHRMLRHDRFHTHADAAVALAITHRLVRVVEEATVADPITKMALITLCDERAAGRYDWVADALVECGERALQRGAVELQEAILAALAPAYHQYKVRHLAYRAVQASDNEFVRETAEPILAPYSIYDATIRFLGGLGVTNPAPVLLSPSHVSGAGSPYSEASDNGDTLRVVFSDSVVQFQAHLPSHSNETVMVGITTANGSVLHARIALDADGHGSSTIGSSAPIGAVRVQLWWQKVNVNDVRH